MNNNNAYTVPAVARALDTIEHLAGQSQSLPIRTISANLAIPKMTTYRIVKYLKGMILEL